MLSLICAWTSGWANNRDAGNLRRHRAYYDVTVMTSDIFLPVRWPSKFWRLLSLLLIDDPASFPPTVFRHKSKCDQSWCCYSLRRNTDRITTIFCKYNDSTHWYGREYKQTPCNRMWNFMEMSSVSNVPWITNKNVPTLQWRHNGRNSVSNHHSRLFTQRFIQAQIKENIKLRVTGLCARNSPGTGEFPAHMASNTETVSIWWRHHDPYKAAVSDLI